MNKIITYTLALAMLFILGMASAWLGSQLAVTFEMQSAMCDARMMEQSK